MMSGHASPLLLGTVMFVAGIGIPLMAALNSGLGTRLGSPVLAGVVLFTVALLVTAAISLNGPALKPSQVLGMPPYLLTGGLVVAFYVLSITWIAPKIGVGNAVFLVLLGQLLSSAVIDHNGWFGAPTTPVSLRRLVGIALMAAGVFLARRPPVE